MGQNTRFGCWVIFDQIDCVLILEVVNWEEVGLSEQGIYETWKSLSPVLSSKVKSLKSDAVDLRLFKPYEFYSQSLKYQVAGI